MWHTKISRKNERILFMAFSLKFDKIFKKIKSFTRNLNWALATNYKFSIMRAVGGQIAHTL